METTVHVVMTEVFHATHYTHLASGGGTFSAIAWFRQFPLRQTLYRVMFLILF